MNVVSGLRYTDNDKIARPWPYSFYIIIMCFRFDRIEDQLEDLENTIISEHFWTRITPTLQDLSNVEKRVDNFFAVSDPAQRAIRMNDLDDTQYQKVFDAISALEDSFEGNNSPLNFVRYSVRVLRCRPKSCARCGYGPVQSVDTRDYGPYFDWQDQRQS